MKIKKRLLILAISLLSTTYVTSSSAKSFDDENIKNAPEKVISAFKKSYPKSKIFEYSKEKENGRIVYEFEIRNGNLKKEILYSENGKLLQIEEEILISSIPIDIINKIKKLYPNFKITSSEKKTWNNNIKYKLEIATNKNERELMFLNGKMLKNEIDD